MSQQDSDWLVDQLDGLPPVSPLRINARALATRIRAAIPVGAPTLIELEPADDSCVIAAVWAATSDPPSGRTHVNRLARACLARAGPDAAPAGNDAETASAG